MVLQSEETGYSAVMYHHFVSVRLRTTETSRTFTSHQLRESYDTPSRKDRDHTEWRPSWMLNCQVLFPRGLAFIPFLSFHGIP